MSAPTGKLSMTKKAIKRRAERALLKSLRPTQLPKAAKPKGPKQGSGSFGAQTRVESGTDVLAVFTIRSSDAVGKSLVNFVVNPRSVEGTRLQLYSDIWQRWTPVSLRLKVSSAAGMMVPGSYIAAWFADPTERLQPKGDTNVRKMVSSGCFLQAPVGQSLTLSIPTTTSRKWYSFKGDSFDDSHGVILIAVAGVTGNTNVSMTVSLEWKIKFNGPDLPTETDDSHLIHNEDEYRNIFTDSVSDWADGKKLTFKHAVGGSVVPWDNLEDDMVYKPVAGVHVNYKTAAGADADCTFFSKMQGAAQYTSALVCHASEADAKAYIKTGHIDKVITYKAAGEWATPSIVYMTGTPVSQALELAPPLGRKLIEPIASTSKATAEQPPPPPSRPEGFDEDALVERILSRLLDKLKTSDRDSPFEEIDKEEN